jgi:hypothetical protein
MRNILTEEEERLAMKLEQEQTMRYREEHKVILVGKKNGEF